MGKLSHSAQNFCIALMLLGITCAATVTCHTFKPAAPTKGACQCKE